MSAMATRTALGKLIDSARAPENLSLQDIADRATRHGARLSKQTVSRLAGEQLDSINVDNIRGLALGLGISERRVAAAALETMGIDIGVDELPLRQAILDADTVGERTKRILLSVIAEDGDADVVELFPKRGQEDHPSSLSHTEPSTDWGPDESEDPSPDQPVVDHVLRDREQFERDQAARKPQPGGSRGRRVRRAQDEDATRSQDDGPEGGA